MGGEEGEVQVEELWDSPFSVMIWGTSLAAGEMHWIWLPTTNPSISERSSKVQLTPADSSGTL